ncbi:hypothetical protein DOK78_001668 [Enterococcus sp. DIV2402]|uniref:Uncharacterized protein n=1 Tax=Candidatus Enterococcus lowellii TaxID=2230877 RepID=A0ABZ2SPU1_9ENTE
MLRKIERKDVLALQQLNAMELGYAVSLELTETINYKN